MNSNNLDLFPEDLPADHIAIDNSHHGVAQRERLLQALQSGTVNTFRARNELGILMPAARAHELRALGWAITTEYLSVLDPAGIERSRIAHYSLAPISITETPPHSVASPSGCGSGYGATNDE